MRSQAKVRRGVITSTVKNLILTETSPIITILIRMRMSIQIDIQRVKSIAIITKLIMNMDSYRAFIGPNSTMRHHTAHLCTLRSMM